MSARPDIAPEAPSTPEQAARPTKKELPTIILRDQVMFPLAIMPFRIQSKREVRLINEIVMKDRMLAIVTSKKPESEEEDLSVAHEIGCVCRVLQLQHVPDGSVNVIIQALRRCRFVDQLQTSPYIVAKIEDVTEPKQKAGDLAPLATTVRMQVSRLIALSPNIPDEVGNALENIEDPGVLSDVVAANLSIPLDQKQELLATLNHKKRLERLTQYLAKEVELLELSNKIHSEVKSSIDKNQREYFLRQQLKAIQQELGEGAGDRSEIEGYRERIDALQLPEEVDREVRRELRRVESMNEASAEYHVLTTYLDWITELPWNTSTEDHLDLERAERVLNEDHYGLDKVKQRILEFLAVIKLKKDASGAILCFVGPPGVGKTSLGKSIARSMGRKFHRMSLGGMRDEAEIRGHRKTYVGAMPGRIIQGIRKAGSRNPVFMLDEIDKLGSDFRGDPSSALLEVLDPAQNDSFSDLYLNVPFDLSNVMFIATANVLETIPWALRDRMEIIRIPGYTTQEKLEIAKKYLVPRQIEAHGLDKKKVKFTVAALRTIISEYTREAGVRNLEREIANVCRGCARHFAGGKRKALKIDKDDLKDYLGRPRVQLDVAERTKVPGVAIGMAWTPTGGDILFIEATKMPGKGQLVLTGQLGKVMKESAQAVVSYVRSNCDDLGIAPEVFNTTDLHIHVPAGAVPKDGPSAGVTILTAVTSLLTGKHIRNDLAMTGEITLRGLVLPVGGIKEKVLAAHRAGIKTIILPKRNEADVEDVPENVRKKLTFHFASHMDDVLDVAFSPEKPAKKKASTKKKKTASKS